ncbi:MAG: YkgJ family cysteine cluster protein [Candidatus Margulisiibacteriota bacterium]
MKYLKRFFMLFVLLDNLLTNLLRTLFRSRWRKIGKCKKCGQCCRQIYLTMTPRQIASPLFTNLAIHWISWLFDFVLLKVDTENHALVFTCKHISLDGKCGNYFWRPNVCRNYPLVDYFKEPVFLPGCGYVGRRMGK